MVKVFRLQRPDSDPGVMWLLHPVLVVFAPPTLPWAPPLSLKASSPRHPSLIILYEEWNGTVRAGELHIHNYYNVISPGSRTSSNAGESYWQLAI
jgi:hypothetical protein